MTGSRPASAATMADDAVPDLGPRAARTRDRILRASRELFTQHGYAATRVGQITAACGISRAGFYTYFRDKREVFDALGVVAYRAVLKAITAWDALPRPAGREDLEQWVAGYFAAMDEHGSFIFSAAQSAPSDRQHHSDSDRMQMRTAWELGIRLRGRQRSPSDAPDALGLAVLGMLDRSWFYSRSARLPVSDRDMIRTVTRCLADILGSVDVVDGPQLQQGGAALAP